MSHRYGFDFKLTGALHVEADSVQQAIDHLKTLLDCASTNFGEIHGTPAVGEVSLDGEPELFEIDDDAIEADDLCSACSEPANDGEGWDGLCGDCADLVAEDDDCATWVRREHNVDFYAESQDGQADWRIAYVRAQKGLPA